VFDITSDSNKKVALYNKKELVPLDDSRVVQYIPPLILGFFPQKNQLLGPPINRSNTIIPIGKIFILSADACVGSNLMNYLALRRSFGVFDALSSYFLNSIM